MKKKFLLSGVIAVLFSGIGLFAGEVSSLMPTKEYVSISYQHGFDCENVSETKTDIMSGFVRFGSVSFWNDSFIGLGANIALGGPYRLRTTDKQTGVSGVITSKDFVAAFSARANVGCAFDIPINDNFNLFTYVGPCYDMIVYGVNGVVIDDIIFGLGGTTCCVVSPKNSVNFVFGLDYSFEFLQLGYVEMGNQRYQASASTMFYGIKPFIGVCFKMDKLYRPD